MHDRPHPGEFITQVYLEPNGISDRELAAKLDVEMHIDSETAYHLNNIHWRIAKSNSLLFIAILIFKAASRCSSAHASR